MNNPFVSRGPVRDEKMFFGRRHELREIAAFLQGNQSVSIVGPRKIGKTSLLFHLMRPGVWSQIGLTSEYLFAYLDCEILGEGSHEEIFAQFASEMIVSLEERQLPIEPTLNKVLEKPSRLALETAIRRLNQRGLRVVLILDEFERLSSNPNLDVNFFNALRSAAGRYQLIFLTASASPLIQLTFSEKSRDILSSPFFNIFAQQFLGLYPEEEAKSLIHIPTETTEKKFSLDTGNFIYKLAGGHPFCLQVACFFAFESSKTYQDIRERTLRELEANFKYYWHNLTHREQETLINLPAAISRLAQDTTQASILRDLNHKCLLILENGTYQYPFQAWADFVQTHADTKDPTILSFPTGTLTGSILGPYEIHEFLARGGMAEVYKGTHSRLGRTVAIKVLSPHLAREADFRRRFEREAQAIAALNHPNIIQIFDFGDFNETFYFVMEYVNGKDLGNYLWENQGPMPVEKVVPILQEIAHALDFAHKQGMVHRDVKPSNVLLGIIPTSHPDQFPYRAILTDFGIAKLSTNSAPTTGAGMMGTLDYIAPEQIQSTRTVDHFADIYALGILTYRMLTGSLPFQGTNPAEVLAGHLYRPMPEPSTYGVHLPAHVIKALEQALEKEPTHRFVTANDLVTALSQP